MRRTRPVQVESLYREIRSVLEQARASAYRAVNATMVQAYWHVGRLVVQHEQQGKARAQYGESVISSLAARLTRDFGRGFDERNLWYMRSFYLAFPILNAARSELPGAKKRAAMRRESPGLRPERTWTHYRLPRASSRPSRIPDASPVPSCEDAIHGPARIC